jgi:hypothetical protein
MESYDVTMAVIAWMLTTAVWIQVATHTWDLLEWNQSVTISVTWFLSLSYIILTVLLYRRRKGMILPIGTTCAAVLLAVFAVFLTYMDEIYFMMIRCSPIIL